MLTVDAWERFEAEADRLGLTHRCASPIAPLTAQLAAEPPPERATHAVLALQAGGTYWEQLRALRRLDSDLDRNADPLDTMTERIAARLAGLLGDGFVNVRFPFRSGLDFVSLGEKLNVGRRSRLSILLHPQYGSWMAFRMLLFVEDRQGIVSPAAALAPHPCDSCAGYCRDACPARAFEGPKDNERLNYKSSFEYRRTHPETCPSACAARLACPVGAEFRYPADFIEAAHRRAFAVGTAYLANESKPTPKTVPPKQGTLF
jgi:ferredoxin